MIFSGMRCGAESVTMYCLEGYDEMPMGEEDRSECERDGVVIRAGWGQTEITSADGVCTGIRLRKCLRVKNDEGRFAPVFDDEQTEETACTTVLYCIGQKADWRTLLTGTAVELRPNGTAVTDPVTGQTAEPDIFAGGDAVTGQKFAIDAIAAGKEGAISLHLVGNPVRAAGIRRQNDSAGVECNRAVGKDRIRIRVHSAVSVSRGDFLRTGDLVSDDGAVDLRLCYPSLHPREKRKSGIVGLIRINDHR